jgi:RsiW-degrading membrane proteinase PrsW (M82 family)
VPRGLSGVLAGGMTALAIVVGLAQWLAAASGRPGPGMSAVAGHALAALVGIMLQLAAERSRDRIATLASWSILMLAAVVLWFGWWA